MDKQELQQKIAEYYSKLPESLQQFFADMKWLNTLQSINTKYNLSPEQTETLATETTLVLLCIIDMREYVKKIESSIKLPTEQMDQLISEINDNIFKDIGYELEDNFIKNVNALAKENSNKEGVATDDIDIPLPPYIKEENKIEEIDEVPLPHYNDNPIPKKEEDFYKESGIEIIENKINDTYNPQEVVPAMDTNSIEREDDKIMKDSGIDIIGSKLFDSTISTRTISDHSLPKMKQLINNDELRITNETNDGDKYREQI